MLPRKDDFSHCEHFLAAYSCLLEAFLLSLFISCLGSLVGETLLVKLLVLLGDKSHCKLPNHLELGKEIASKRYQLGLDFTVCISIVVFFLLQPPLKQKIPLMRSKDYTYLWRKTYGKIQTSKKISTTLTSKKIKGSFL